MTDAIRLDEIRQAAARLSILAARCQDAIEVAVRLPDGRVLAPTTAPQDAERYVQATDELRVLLAV